MFCIKQELFETVVTVSVGGGGEYVFCVGSGYPAFVRWCRFVFKAPSTLSHHNTDGQFSVLLHASLSRFGWQWVGIYADRLPVSSYLDGRFAPEVQDQWPSRARWAGARGVVRPISTDVITRHVSDCVKHALRGEVSLTQRMFSSLALNCKTVGWMSEVIFTNSQNAYRDVKTMMFASFFFSHKNAVVIRSIKLEQN